MEHFCSISQTERSVFGRLLYAKNRFQFHFQIAPNHPIQVYELEPSQAQCTLTHPIIRARVGSRAVYLQSLRVVRIRDPTFRVKMTSSQETEVAFKKIRPRVIFC